MGFQALQQSADGDQVRKWTVECIMHGRRMWHRGPGSIERDDEIFRIELPQSDSGES
jgi:hypothetical protein